MGHTVVLGGGICGLAAGTSLAEHGEQVTVLEAQHFLGGLATTLKGNTGAGYDFGPHAYHARNQRVLDMFKELAHDGFPAMHKNVRIKFRGKYYKYPLEALDIAKSMSPLVAARAFFDFFIESVRRRVRPKPLVSAEDWMVRRWAGRSTTCSLVHTRRRCGGCRRPSSRRRSRSTASRTSRC